MSNEKQTATMWLTMRLSELEMMHYNGAMSAIEFLKGKMKVLEQAKEKEKEQRGYTKEDVLKAGEMGEINHHDTKHIVSYLDEARDFNETYGSKNEQ
jgi:hypothetical protein